ncbi:MAG: FctA domain-containing protein [Firmicutes bacterium]|nr:FctA domain-containing protein [Bacillota bacterium]
MKKLISLALALVLVLSMAAVAFAAECKEASFTKTYQIANAGTTSPQETFTFTFTPWKLTDSNENLSLSNMPQIPSVTTTFAEGTATKDGLVQTVNVALSGVAWPGVGVYYYKVEETAGDTAGVLYDQTTAYLKVTVAYDTGTNTYYTAFVTLNLADENQDGITDNKTGGFTNCYSAGSLSVKKEVTGNLGDQTKEFNVTVEFTAPEGKTVRSTISYQDGTESKTIAPSAWVDGKASAEITLKHDETVTFTNIPYGVTYTVTEADYTTQEKGGYDAATYNYSDTDKVINSDCDQVTVTNHKSVGVDTGVTLDSLPFILILAVCAGAAVLMVVKRRKTDY